MSIAVVFERENQLNKICWLPAYADKTGLLGIYSGVALAILDGALDPNELFDLT
jgi:hypothetical protein